jgi:hypothetical protein
MEMTPQSPPIIIEPEEAPPYPASQSGGAASPMDGESELKDPGNYTRSQSVAGLLTHGGGDACPLGGDESI